MKLRILFIALFATILILSMTGYSQSSQQVMVINFNMSVDPGAVSLFQRSFNYALSNGIHYVIIEMNTPGGMMDSMLSIVSLIEQAEINITVITYVPVGGMAASAGSYIAMASDYIFMANGTFIGPSTPYIVGVPSNTSETQHVVNASLALMESLAQKHNRNVSAVIPMVESNVAYTAQQAYKLNVINGLSDSLSNVFARFNLTNANIIYENPSFYDQFVSFISNPTVDGLLITLGILAILLDLYHATVLLTIVGVISLVLGFWGSELISGNVVAIILFIIAAGLIIAEIKVSHGIFLIVGVFLAIFATWLLASGVSYSPGPFSLSSYLVFTGEGIVAFIGAYYLNWIRKSLRTTPKAGPETIIGKSGFVTSDLSPEGEIRVNGIIWRARSKSGQTIKAGKKVKVVERDGLVLIVEEEKDGN